MCSAVCPRLRAPRQWRRLRRPRTLRRRANQVDAVHGCGVAAHEGPDRGEVAAVRRIADPGNEPVARPSEPRGAVGPEPW